MAYARFGPNAGHFYSNVVSPTKINLTFTVAATDSAGLGITSLKSNGFVNNVFMHTSATPGANNGVTNPNPAVGFALIQLKQNYNVYLQGMGGFVSQNGSAVKIDNSAMTAGQVYTITTLGNATAAKWTAIGVPAGVTPAVGVSFVAASNGGAGNTLTSRVSAPGVSGIVSMELVGNPNTMTNSSIAANAGQWVFVQFLAPTSSSVTTLIPAAPADASQVTLSLLFDGSSVSVDGL